MRLETLLGCLHVLISSDARQYIEAFCYFHLIPVLRRLGEDTLMEESA